MKALSCTFAVLAILLSDVMCAVVAFNYCDMLWGIRYASYSAPASTAFLLVIPYAAAIAVCTALAVIFWRKSANAEKNHRMASHTVVSPLLSHKQDAERVRAAVARDGAARLRLFDGLKRSVLCRFLLRRGTTLASAAAWVMNASSGAMSSRPSRRSFTYWRMHFSNEPRYFLHTAILPFRTSMQGFRCRRFAPSAATAEQRPPFRM